MSCFNNKVVWITGASSGIGEALTYALAKAGARLILSARNVPALEQVKQQSESKNIYILPLDLTEPDTFEVKTQEAIRAFGQVDILVHNGGISQRSYIRDTEMAVYRRIMEVDYFGYVGLTKAILPHFVKRQAGHFVVVSSVLGKLTTPMRAAYASAKHALHGFFDGLRAEYWQKNITVTMICPGYVRTQIAVNALTATGEAYNQMGKDTGGGYPADRCALQMMRAIKRKKNEVYVGKPLGKEKLALLLKRFFPGLLAKIARKAAPQ